MHTSLTEHQTDKRFRSAKIINVSLNIIIAVLAIALLLMLIAGLSLQFDTGLKQSLMDKLEATGQAVPPIKSLTIGYLAGAVIAGAYLYVALVVRRIVQTTLDGNPFVGANISRLRTTWIVIALVELFRVFVTGFIERSTHMGAETGSAMDGFTLETRLSAWFLVFVIAAMAEVFRIGLELRRDQELTV